MFPRGEAGPQAGVVMIPGPVTRWCFFSESVYRKPAIDRKALPRDVRCPRHAEECNCSCNLFGLADAAHRRAADDFVVIFLVAQDRFDERRIDVPRRYRIDTDAVRSPLDRKVARHLHERCFCHRIGGPRANVLQPGDGYDIYYGARLAGFQKLHGGAVVRRDAAMEACLDIVEELVEAGVLGLRLQATGQ